MIEQEPLDVCPRILIGYRTREQAYHVAATSWWRNHGGRVLQPVACICGNWHLMKGKQHAEVK